MGADTKIQWADHTFNPWRGCTKIAPGCANCYAESQAKRNPATLGVWGPSGTRVVASEVMWREPIKWNRDAALREDSYQIAAMTCRSEYDIVEAPERPRVFCASLADVFEDWPGAVFDAKGNGLFMDGDEWFTPGVGFLETSRMATLDDVRARLFRLIDATPNLDWLLLTKRPENVRKMWPQAGFANAGVPGTLGRNVKLDNVWLGTSIACQDDADRLIPELLKCRDLCAKIFVSIEPLIEPVTISKWLGPQTEGQWLNVVECGHESCDYGVGWVIVGGESGLNARPCDVGWIRSIVRQCRGADVPVFVKQLGAAAFEWTDIDDRPRPESRDKHFPGLRDRKGGDPSEWPEDLQVREVPT